VSGPSGGPSASVGVLATSSQHVAQVAPSGNLAGMLVVHFIKLCV
jgi:hypothetical protein